MPAASGRRSIDTYFADRSSVSLDCHREYRNVLRSLTGPSAYLPSGGLAVVPASSTPVRRTTWGALKTIYR